MEKKKKVNVRREYDLGSKDVIVYAKASIPRKIYLQVIRGPGMKAPETVEENVEMNSYVRKNHGKVKYFSFKTEEELMALMKDANTWASGILVNPGIFQMASVSDTFKRALKKLLIPVQILPAESCTPDTYVDALKSLVAKAKKS